MITERFPDRVLVRGRRRDSRGIRGKDDLDILRPAPLVILGENASPRDRGLQHGRKLRERTSVRGHRFHLALRVVERSARCLHPVARVRAARPSEVTCHTRSVCRAPAYPGGNTTVRTPTATTSSPPSMTRVSGSRHGAAPAQVRRRAPPNPRASIATASRPAWPRAATRSAKVTPAISCERSTHDEPAPTPRIRRAVMSSRHNSPNA